VCVVLSGFVGANSIKKAAAQRALRAAFPARAAMMASKHSKPGLQLARNQHQK
jgi:hypothetical protein